jgi:hypothetical protein
MTQITSFSNPRHHHYHHQIYKTSMTRGKEKHIPNCRHGQGRDGESGVNEKKCLLLGFRLAYQMYAAPATTATNANDSPTCVALSCCCSCPISPPISYHDRPLLLLSLFPPRHTPRSRVWEPLLLCSLSLSLSLVQSAPETLKTLKLQSVSALSLSLSLSLSRRLCPRNPKSALC